MRYPRIGAPPVLVGTPQLRNRALRTVRVVVTVALVGADAKAIGSAAVIA